jgi:hypothetical protein
MLAMADDGGCCDGKGMPVDESGDMPWVLAVVLVTRGL